MGPKYQGRYPLKSSLWPKYTLCLPISMIKFGKLKSKFFFKKNNHLILKNIDREYILFNGIFGICIINNFLII